MEVIEVVLDAGADMLGLFAHLLHQPGPWMGAAKPGKFSTSVVMVSWPPGCMPATSRGCSPARAA
jgi:hypothetical protein